MLQKMRRDWDARALANAEGHIYTRDSERDEAGFDASGKANYDQLVRPFLPVLLGGRAARECRVAEIGCGIGRMTRWFAEQFGEVCALDISPEMIARARQRLGHLGNVHLFASTGEDLRPLPDAQFDLVFSYIVFQHIPSRVVIENYVREAARVLKPGGAFKFQLNGDRSPAYLAAPRDTWLGETFSYEEAVAMLQGFCVLSAEGTGTQYFVLTARKGAAPPEPEPRPYIFPGEAWAARQLLEGWGEPVEESWRPVAPLARARLFCAGTRFFLGIYFWPEEPFTPRMLQVSVDGQPIGAVDVLRAGDAYVELPAECAGEAVIAEIRIHPAPPRAPAVRALGFYRPL